MPKVFDSEWAAVAGLQKAWEYLRYRLLDSLTNVKENSQSTDDTLGLRLPKPDSENLRNSAAFLSEVYIVP